MLGYIKSSMTSRLREGILPPYSTVLRPHLASCGQLWTSQHRRDMDLLEWVQWRATKMVRGLENLLYEVRLRELGFFSMEKGRLWGDLIVTLEYLKGTYKKDGER